MRGIAITILAAADALLIFLLCSQLWTFVKNRRSRREQIKTTLRTHRLVRICAGTIKASGVVVTVLAVLIATFVLWYLWDRSKNRGFTFGYYGQFNAVSNAMAELPGITVLGSGHNPDITLEEFGFTLQTDRGQRIELWFSEMDPIREITRKKLAAALSERVKTELANKAARPAP